MAGAGYKLFNTGDVLTAAQVNTYLMEQTVMVFANAAARTTALSGVVSEGMISYLKDTNAVEVYDGSNWVSSDDPNAIQNTIVDAKGDLIAASAADTPARLAVGNNGETLVADSSTSTGLRYTAGNALGNPVLNSAFQVWQRGTSGATATGSTNGFVADRWQGFRSAYAAGMTMSRQTTSDTTNLPFIQYSVRVQRDSGNTSTSRIHLLQTFESMNSIPYAGRTVTLSFYARKGANFSPTNGQIGVILQTGTGTDQNAINGFTNLTNPIDTGVSPTTTWQRFSATATIASDRTQIAIFFYCDPSGTAGANDWFEVTGVQLDVGSVALPFRTYAATLAGELAACQRYYWRQTGELNYSVYAMGANTSTTNCNLFIQFPQIMRTSPSAVEYSNLALQESNIGTVIAVTALALDGNTQNTKGVCVNAGVASGLTQHRVSRIEANNSASAYIGFSAEL